MKTKFSIFLLIIAGTYLGCAGSTRIQRPNIQEQPLAPGDRVRVSAPKVNSKPFVGIIDALDADTLFLENQITLPLASVTKIEVSRGRKSKAGTGAGIGALVGAGTGAAMGFSDGDDPPLFSEGEPFLFSAEQKAGLGAIAGGGIGAIIGALIGANQKSDRWEEVPLEKVRAGNFQ